MTLEYISKDTKGNNVKLLKITFLGIYFCNETEAYFITKIYTQERYFYAEDKKL